MLMKAVEPVVVNPDIASKKASAGRCMCPPKRKGEHAQDAVDDPHDGDDEKTISTLKVCGTFSPQESPKASSVWCQMQMGTNHVLW